MHTSYRLDWHYRFRLASIKKNCDINLIINNIQRNQLLWI